MQTVDALLMAALSRQGPREERARGLCYELRAAGVPKEQALDVIRRFAAGTAESFAREAVEEVFHSYAPQGPWGPGASQS